MRPREDKAFELNPARSRGSGTVRLLHSPGGMTLIEQLQKRNRETALRSWLLTLAAAACVLLAGTCFSLSPRPLATLSVAGAACAYAAWRFGSAAASTLGNASASRVYGAVTQAPEAIVWTYRVRMLTRRGPQWSLRVCLADGASWALEGTEEQTDALLKQLQQRAPAARFGV